MLSPIETKDQHRPWHRWNTF